MKRLASDEEHLSKEPDGSQQVSRERNERTTIPTTEFLMPLPGKIEHHKRHQHTVGLSVSPKPAPAREYIELKIDI